MLKELDYKELVENKYNPRKRFDDAKMVELTDSIKKVGLLEPLVVRKVDGKYEVVCGVRRYKALGHINNGKKIPVNVVDVDDHQAMVLSFTENFQRSDFTPIESARFFAKALSLSDSIESVPGPNSQEIVSLSKEIPCSAATIERRLMLLALPEKVQIMVENDNLLLGVAEIISRLRFIKDKKIRHKYMIQFALEYQGTEPNIQKLKQEVETKKETYEDQQKEQEGEIEKYQKAAEEKKEELKTTLDKILSWYNEQFKTKLKFDIEAVDEFIKELQDKGHKLTTDKSFDLLTKEQAGLEERRDRVQMNLKIVIKEHLDTCPFCGGYARAKDMKANIDEFDERISSIVEEKKSISRIANEIEKYRENLRKISLTYQTAIDTLNKLSGDEGEVENV